MKPPLIASAHATQQYAKRILGLRQPNLDQQLRARELLLAEFSDYEITVRRGDRSRVVVAPSGIHACIDTTGELITVFTPGVPVIGCWCEHCNVARAPHTRKVPRRRRQS